MNATIIGTADNTDWLLEHAKQPFLLLDDGPVADAFIARFPKAKVFDPAEHSFNPLSGIDYKRARDFAEILYTASPQGTDTLTVRNGRRTLARLFLRSFTRLDKLLGYLQAKADTEVLSPAYAEALGTVGDLLLSPVLRRVLCSPGKQFKFDWRPVVARIDRAALGDFDAFILASLLVAQFQGQVIVPDFVFYGRPLHVSLMRQGRLLCGVNCLDDLPQTLRQAVMLFPTKEARRCLPEDAERLAAYSGFLKGQHGYSEFVAEAVRG